MKQENSNITNNKIHKVYAYQADEMIAIWLEFGHEPDVQEFQVSARDVK